MSEARDHTETARALRRLRTAALAFAAAALAFLYFHDAAANPPGFFVDESSIAYNAHAVARAGVDEHGEAWPLFFRAFGEYKSPAYVYLLAALFKMTGPSIAVARALSAALGLAAAALLGLLAARILNTTRDAPPDGRDRVASRDARAPALAGLFVFVAAALTPWLFEVSRLVFEVALFPAALALFLLLLHSSARREEWGARRAALLGASLALLVYTYSSGRVVAPLLAAGLAFFWSRRRRRGVVAAWLFFALALAPLFVFEWRHAGALGSRFQHVTFVTPQMSWAEVLWRFAANYLAAFDPRGWLLRGDPEPRHHVQTMGSVLLAVWALACAGLLSVVRSRRLRGDAWWRFVLYGLAVAPVPSALTLDHFHTLRLVALPVFALVLNTPALARLLAARHDGDATRGGVRTLRSSRARLALFALLAACALAQGLLFQRQFREAAPRRWHNFDAFYPEVFDAALARPERPVYLRDENGAPGYMHAYWYAALRGLDLSNFARLPKDERPPAGALVISTELPCHDDCQLLLQRAGFRAYVQK
ncbi:MAG TPA: hypothetical protein VER32_08535 [Pyrinomonadaceae bacterium]|nr:hypothetical protein [Pyrinomonadaceae bacterium]